MECKQNIFIQPVLTTWGVLAHERKKALIQVSPTDPTAKKAVAWLVNGTKNRLMELAIVVSTIFTLIYSAITYPFRLYQFKKNIKITTEKDLSQLNESEKAKLFDQIDNYFKKHDAHFSKFSKKHIETLKKELTAFSARSMKVYGPVARMFVEHLLEEANRENAQLIFMARDGIPYFEIAKKLMKKPEYIEKYPNLNGDHALVLAPFSRKLLKNVQKTAEGMENFKNFTKTNLGVIDGKRCYFVDIGFNGTVKPDLLALFPNNPIDLKFLVATSDKADGFLANPQHPLPGLTISEHNLGRGWLEETHGGTLAKATDLIQDKEGKISPNNILPKKNKVSEKFSDEYLVRKFCLKALVDYAIDIKSLTDEELFSARELLSKTVQDISAHKYAMVAIGDQYDHPLRRKGA